MEIYGKVKEFGSFEQFDTNCCGPACVEMLLDYFDLRPDEKTSEELQKEILKYEKEAAASAGATASANDNFQPGQWDDWVTTPIELVNMLHGIKDNVGAINQENPDRLSNLSNLWINYFMKQADHESNAEYFMNELERKLIDPNQPALIIPIHGSSHWVVLYQVTVNGGKKNFIGKDPMIYSKKEKIGKSITSLKGKITIARNKLNFSNPDNLLMIMFTGVGVSSINSRLALVGNRRPTPTIQLPGTSLQPQEVLGKVNEQLVAFGIRAASSVGRVAFMSNFTTPLLVNHRNRPNNDYYLVTEKNAAGDITQIIRMDAQTGDFLDSLMIEPTKLILGKSATEQAQGNLLVNVNLSLPKTTNARVSANWSNALKDELNKTDSQGNNAPKLIWEPSRESESAFFPFYEVTANNETTYVRIDGTHFPKINPTSTPISAPQVPSTA